jgi:hypothetical protein
MYSVLLMYPVLLVTAHTSSLRQITGSECLTHTAHTTIHVSRLLSPYGCRTTLFICISLQTSLRHGAYDCAHVSSCLLHQLKGAFQS